MKTSIITINLNNLQGLKSTYRSIVSQTSKDWEWIVIDGGSNKGDKEFLLQHQNEIAYWCSEPDGGVYNAINKGIAKAQGEYLICMNSGDCFHDAHVLESVFSNEQTADVLYGDWQRVYFDGRREQKYAPKQMDPYFFYYDNICHQSIFIKTSVMQGSPFDESYKIYADWAKWRELQQKGHTFAYVPCTVCDFEAGTGISERLSEIIEYEVRKMENNEPEGIKMIKRNLENLENENQELKRKLQRFADVKDIGDNKYAVLTYKLARQHRIFAILISGYLKLLRLFTTIETHTTVRRDTLHK